MPINVILLAVSGCFFRRYLNKILILCISSCQSSYLLARNDGVVPFRYLFIIEQEAENGSLAVGNCSDTGIFGSTTICNQPASSFLFDGKTPTLIGLSSNMWASQLFTLSSEDGGRSIPITFDFDGTPGYTGVGAVEVTMFNCPDWSLAVRSIRLQNSRGESILSSSQVPTSCTSLVTDMLCSQSQLRSSQIRMAFDLQPNSDRVYIAEMTFFPTSVICDTNDTSDTPPLLSDTTVSLQPTIRIASSTPQDTNDLPTSTIILATVLTGVLIVLCLLAAVLILWRCYYVKHHKHNTSHHPAVGEGHVNTHSHPPPVTLCEDNGQAYYTAAERVDSSLDAQWDTLLKQETPIPSNSPSGEYDVIKTKENRAYSVALVGHGSTQDTSIRDVTAPVYSAIDGKKEKPIETERSKAVSAPLACSITDTDKPERKYASVRGKSNETEQDATSSEPACHVYAVPERKISPESGTSTAPGDSALDRDVHLLPQVNESTGHVYAVLENKGIQQPPEVDVSTGHIYAVLENEDVQQQVDVSTGHVYAVLEREDAETSEEGGVENTLNNQLHTANATHLYTPEADIPVKKLYTRVDKKKKDGDTSTHSHTPEADKPVDKLYAQVDKRKKERKGKEVCEDSPREN